MTTHPFDLERFRAELRDAIDKDLARRAARRRTVKLTAGLAVPGLLAVALGVVLSVVLVTGPGMRPADAAVLTAAQSALTPPAGTILHERATVTVGGQPPQRYEVWIEAAAPGAYRVIKFGHEAAWNGKTISVYEQASNTITVGTAIPSYHFPLDIAATMRSLIASGRAQVTGTTMADGVPAYRLTITGLPGGWVSGVANGTYEAARSNSHPLLIETTVDCGSGRCPETVRFQIYQYLPATPANLSLLDLRAQHPKATVVPLPSPDRSEPAPSQGDR
jgi:hypothetical protein